MSGPANSRRMDLPTEGIVALRTMLLIREFELRLAKFQKEGLIRGSTHSSVGMEATAVGISMTLQSQDCITSNHRGHAHVLARGADPGRTLAEIFGRRDGYCQGHGGSMHIGVRDLGILGTNGVVGAGIGLATGAALSARIRHANEVCIAYFGDGASNQGVLAECFNLTALWSLPVVFVCENNQYAQSSALRDMVAEMRLVRRGEAYGVPSLEVDGMDVEQVYSASVIAVERARRGEGPTFMVAESYRYLGHMAGDTEIYRGKKEVEEWKSRDPIDRLYKRLLELEVMDDDHYASLKRSVVADIDEAEDFARSSPLPDPASAVRHVLGGAI